MMLTELNAGSIDSDKFKDFNIQVKLLCGVTNCCYTCVWLKWYCLTLISLILVLCLTSEIQHCIKLIHHFTMYLRHCVSYNNHHSTFMRVNDTLFINTLTCFGQRQYHQEDEAIKEIKGIHQFICYIFTCYIW